MTSRYVFQCTLTETVALKPSERVAATSRAACAGSYRTGTGGVLKHILFPTAVERNRTAASFFSIALLHLGGEPHVMSMVPDITT